jgi:hypothetical protein
MAHGGDGLDTFLLSEWDQVGGPVTIVDFNVSEDSLVLMYEDSGNGDPEVDIRQDTNVPNRTEVLVDGIPVAIVMGGGGLSAADITLLPQGGPGATELLRV